jgi:hypothetical protein
VSILPLTGVLGVSFATMLLVMMALGGRTSTASA